MKKIVVAMTFGAAIAVTAASGSSVEYELAQLVHHRRAEMFHMLSAYWPMLAISKGNSSDLAGGARAARTVLDAMTTFVTMLPAGTSNVDIFKTRAKPEVWSEPQEFQAAVDALRSSATALLDAAEANDLAAFKARFDTFAQACVGCHGLKPSSSGRFRAELQSGMR
jgi:cytochrome c556